MKTKSFNHLLRKASAPFLLIILLLLGACGRGGIDYSEEAKAHANQVYERLGQRDYQEAAALYSPRFYERVPRERWIETLAEIEENLGRYRRHSLIQARTQTFGPEDNPGETFTVLMYRVNYDEEEAIEQLTFSTRNSPIELVNHQLVADRIAVRFDEPDVTIRVASRDDERERTPAPVEKEPEPLAEEEIAGTEHADKEPEIPMEERILSELTRITAPGQNAETRRYIDQLAISAIAPGWNRIIVNGRLLKEGEAIGQGVQVRLKAVEPRRVVFSDGPGAEYEKSFLPTGR